MYLVFTLPIGSTNTNCLKPPLRLNGLAYKVLQWYMCRMKGWFATEIDNISTISWNEVRGHFVISFSMISYVLKCYQDLV